MDLVGVLVSLGSIGLALAGFVGLLTVFRDRREPWPPIEAQGVRVLLMTSVAAMLFSLAPVPALVAEAPTGSLWAAALALIGLFIGYFAVAIPLEIRRRPLPVRYPVLLWSVLAGQAVVAIAALLGAAGLLGLRHPASYVAALIWLLFVAAIQFLAQIFAMLREPRPTGANE